jgi:hypothetical protein
MGMEGTHLSYVGSINRRIEVQAIPGINATLYLKNNESKKSRGLLKWESTCLASSSPEFKP